MEKLLRADPTVLLRRTAAAAAAAAAAAVPAAAQDTRKGQAIARRIVRFVAEGRRPPPWRRSFVIVIAFSVARPT